MRVPRHTVLLVSATLVLAGMLGDIQTSGMLLPFVSIIASHEHMTISQVGWLINAGSVGAAIAVSFTARLGDTYGHRRVLLTVVVLAMLGTLDAALAHSFWAIVIGRFFMGTALSVPLGWGLVRARPPRPKSGRSRPS
jgi:MFS family permease